MTFVKQLAVVRERTEDLERASLSTWATLASESKGRDRYEEPDPLRTAFQQDRDRILQARAFQRLKDKSQSLADVESPQRRVRLTHTLEVARVAGTIARALRLNEDLVAAIALGHELGQPPFADAGEEALSVFTDARFVHQEQSLRVVERLEGGGAGLNLTWEVRDGILHHREPAPQAATTEGQVVQQAVRIAGVMQDLDAALEAKLVAVHELPHDVHAVLGASPDQQEASMVADVVVTSVDQPELQASPTVDRARRSLVEFLSTRVARRLAVRAERDRALHCLRSLGVFYLENPDDLPFEQRGEEPLVVRVLDVLAEMTDAEAKDAFARRFLPGGPPSGL